MKTYNLGTKLHRSRRDSMIRGVCGGLAETLGIDSTMVRLFFVLVALLGGASIVMYLILWLVMPPDGQSAPTTPGENQQAGTDEISQRARSLGNEANGSYSHQGDTFLSEGYDTAKDRVELEVQGGVGNVTIR